MALILKATVSGKRCWACAQEMSSDDAAVVCVGASEVMYMHPNCAQSISQQMLRDLSQLVDLGYELDS